MALIGKRNSFYRVEAYDIGDETTMSSSSSSKSSSRTQIDHAGNTITPRVGGGDTTKGPLCWRRDLIANEHEITHGDWSSSLLVELQGQIVRQKC